MSPRPQKAALARRQREQRRLNAVAILDRLVHEAIDSGPARPFARDYFDRLRERIRKGRGVSSARGRKRKP